MKISNYSSRFTASVVLAILLLITANSLKRESDSRSWDECRIENSENLSNKVISKLYAWVGAYYERNNSNQSIAEKWYVKAANCGDAKSQFKMATTYFKRNPDTDDYIDHDQDGYITAFSWLLQSATQGYNLAQYELGSHYEKSHNYVKSDYWYKEAAKQGIDATQYNLAIKSKTASNPESSSLDVNKLNLDWYVEKLKDNFTDETTVKAIKDFNVADTKIQVIAECNNNTQREVNKGTGIVFSFNLYSVSNHSKSYEHTSLGKAEGVATQYRLDNGRVKLQPSYSDYKNVAELAFYDPSVWINEISIIIPSPLFSFETPKELLKANLLRVRLPIQGSDPIDIEIDLANLNDFFESCSITQTLKNKTSNISSADQLPHADTTISVPSPQPVQTPINSRIAVNSASIPAPLASKPAVHCSNTHKSAVDVLVCSDTNLLTLDAKVNTAYHEKQAKGFDSNLDVEQNNWMDSRSRDCGLQPFNAIDAQESSRLINCLNDLYNRRLYVLQ